MLVALRASRNACLRSRFIVCSRALKSYATLHVDGDAPDSAKRSRKRTVRKKYADLEINSSSVPLDEWDGGLPKSKAKKRAGKASTPETPIQNSSDCSSGMPAESAPVSDTVPKKRRERKPKVDISTEDAVEPITTRPFTSTLAAGILENLAKFPHCILLTRVGQFYESYFDQAKEVSELLNIKLTQRTFSSQREWMCGFPLVHLDKSLKVLVQHHKRFVAICEEFPRDPRLGPKAGFDRRVVRIVTPGTLIDETFLNPYENNYLLSVTFPPGSSPDSQNLGLAWIDVSTGEFFTKSIPADELQDELVRIGPREVILDEVHAADKHHPVRKLVSEEGYFASYFPLSGSRPDVPKQLTQANSSLDDITTHAKVGKEDEEDEEDEDDVVYDGWIAKPTIALSTQEVDAISLLTAYMRANLLEHMPQLSSPSRETVDGRMQIDAHTIRALEIRESLTDGGTSGSLLGAIKRTVTSSGTRLLARWLCSPSTSIDEINARLSLVSFFHTRPHLRADLAQKLRGVEDTSRLLQRLLVGRGQPASDLLAIHTTINRWRDIELRLDIERYIEEKRADTWSKDWAGINALMIGTHNLQKVSRRIRDALFSEASLMETDIVEDDLELNEGEEASAALPIPSLQLRTTFFEKWRISPRFSEELQGLHDKLQDLHHRRQQLESDLQVAFAAPSLTLRVSPGQGMHVHIAKGKRDSTRLAASGQFIPLSASNSTSTFFYQEWSLLGEEIFDTISAIYVAEKNAVEALRNEISTYAQQLRHTARIFDELDVTIAFANLAEEMKFVKPVVIANPAQHIVNGRHPTVELGLLTSGRTFTPNSVEFSWDSQVHVITGPNMAGKSTFLRQTALMTVLAQCGSFVPADSAVMGIVDKLFSRIGARDDLFRDRSTFMVEMLETSDILRRATPRSLVIMDEVGRGTTVDDGLAIAFAAIHHLLHVNGSRTLFATHFHELADLLGNSENDGFSQRAGLHVKFFCTGVDESEDGRFSYSHRLRPGVNRDSHGLKVAQLAGLPLPAIQVATATLARLKEIRNYSTHAEELHAIGASLM